MKVNQQLKHSQKCNRRLLQRIFHGDRYFRKNTP